MSTFFLVMTLYPEIQKRAQDEIDSIVGQERLPHVKDRDSLPYIEAIIKEILRWAPVVPVGAFIGLAFPDNFAKPVTIRPPP